MIGGLNTSTDVETVIDYLQPIEPASAVCDLCDRLVEQIPASEYSLYLDLLTFRETCTPWHGRQLADALCVAKRPDLAEQVEALLPADVPSGMMFFIYPPFVVSHPAAGDLMARLMQEWDERAAQDAGSITTDAQPSLRLAACPGTRAPARGQRRSGSLVSQSIG